MYRGILTGEFEEAGGIGRVVLRGRPGGIVGGEELDVAMEAEFTGRGGDFDSFEGGGDLVVGG